MPLFRASAPVPTPEPPPVAPAHELDEPLPRFSHRALVEAWLTDLRPVTPRAVPVDEALGLELCEDLDSDLELPVLDASEVDGVGVRAANIAGASQQHPIDLRLVAAIEAGDPPSPHTLPAGACVLLGRGAPVPAGVDAIVPRALVTVTGRSVVFEQEAPVGAHVRRRGRDLAEGAPLARAGQVVDFGTQVRLVEAGQGEVLVRPRPRIGVLTVGVAVLPAGAPMTAYTQRYATPAALVAGFAQAQGASVTWLGVVGRDAAALRGALASVADLDLVLVVAGDDVDVLFVAEAVAPDASEAPLSAVHLAVNDGLTLAHGRLGATPVAVVPAAGPRGAAAAYAALFSPMIARLTGRPTGPSRRALTDDIAPAPRDRWVLSGEEDRGPRAGSVRPCVDAPDAAASALAAGGVAVVPAGGAHAGDTVAWWPLPTGRP